VPPERDQQLAEIKLQIFWMFVVHPTDTIVNGVHNQSSPFDGTDPVNMPLNVAASPVREQAANTLLRARRLPRGPYRNDLRQLGVGLLRLYKQDSLRTSARKIDEKAA
jgi:hypothetical protein